MTTEPLISLDEAKEMLVDEIIEATEQQDKERLATLQKHTESEEALEQYAKKLNDEAQAEIEKQVDAE